MKKTKKMASYIWLWLVMSVVGQYKTRTADCGPGLRTGYKTWTRYKTRLRTGYKTRTEGCGPKCRLDVKRGLQIRYETEYNKTITSPRFIPGPQSWSEVCVLYWPFSRP